MNETYDAKSQQKINVKVRTWRDKENIYMNIDTQNEQYQ